MQAIAESSCSSKILKRESRIVARDFTNISNFLFKLSTAFKADGRVRAVIAILAFAGMILAVSAGLFGAYTLGFYDGIKDGQRLDASRAR
jgi:hypothetical protein